MKRKLFTLLLSATLLLTPASMFTDPDLRAPAYPGLTAFFEALSAWAFNLQAGEQALLNMADASPNLWTPDEYDIMDWYGYPDIGTWRELPDVWGALYRHTKQAYKGANDEQSTV